VQWLRSGGATGFAVRRVKLMSQATRPHVQPAPPHLMQRKAIKVLLHLGSHAERSVPHVDLNATSPTLCGNSGIEHKRLTFTVWRGSQRRSAAVERDFHGSLREARPMRLSWRRRASCFSPAATERARRAPSDDAPSPRSRGTFVGGRRPARGRRVRLLPRWLGDPRLTLTLPAATRCMVKRDLTIADYSLMLLAR
jgi:hypothetical protein